MSHGDTKSGSELTHHSVCFSVSDVAALGSTQGIVPFSTGLTRLFEISLWQIPTFSSMLAVPSEGWRWISWLTAPVAGYWCGSLSPTIIMAIKALI